MCAEEQKYSRQILAFGKEGQNKISEVKVGVVGLGGMGSAIAQMLAYLGVKRFILIDDDIVDETNLNRLIGATIKDVENKSAKTEIARKLIKSINPDARITTYQNLKDEVSLDVLSNEPDIIFGCVDNDSARLILTELCAAFEKVLIDSATEIFVEENYFGGRVVFAIPKEFCLKCAGQIDFNIAQQELESKEEKTFRVKHGYGLGPHVPAPAIVSVNGIIAGLAVTEFVVYITKVRKPNKRVTYKGMKADVNVINESLDKIIPGCYYCDYLAGKRELANIKRYSKNDLPSDLPE